MSEAARTALLAMAWSPVILLGGISCAIVLPFLEDLLRSESAASSDAGTAQAASGQRAQFARNAIARAVAARDVILEAANTGLRASNMDDLLAAAGAAFSLLILADVVFSFVLPGRASGSIGLVLGLAVCSSFCVLAASCHGREITPDHLAICATFALAATLGLAAPLFLAGSQHLPAVSQAQHDQGVWFGVVEPLGFAIYLICAAAMLRAAGSGKSRGGTLGALLRDATEAIDVVLLAVLATLLFLGGSARPLARIHDRLLGTGAELLDALPPVLMIGLAFALFRLSRRETARAREKLFRTAAWTSSGCAAILITALIWPAATAVVHGIFWFSAKLLFAIWILLWLRMKWAAYSFRQQQKLAWRLFIPLGILNCAGVVLAIALREGWGWTPGFSIGISTVLAIGATWLFFGSRRWPVRGSEPRPGYVD